MYKTMELLKIRELLWFEVTLVKRVLKGSNKLYFFLPQYEKQFTSVGLDPGYYDRLWDLIMARLSDPMASSTHQTCLSAIRILRCVSSLKTGKVYF